MTAGLFSDEDDPALTAVKALELEAAQLYVRQNEALLHVWDTAPDDSTCGQHPQVLAEIAALLQLHPASINGRLGVALAFRSHPALPSLLRDGRLGIAHALGAVQELDALEDPELAARVLQEVLLAGGNLGFDGTPAELRRAIRRTAIRLDPAGAKRRRQQQQAQRTGIRLRPLPDGLASWTATGGAPQLSAADRLLDVLSRPTGPDDTRSRGQRQLDALLAALIVRAGTAVELELQLGLPVQVTDSTPVGGGCPPEPVIIQTDLTSELLAVLAGTRTSAPAPAPALGQPDEPEPEPEPEPEFELDVELAQRDIDPEPEFELIELELHEPELDDPELDDAELFEPEFSERGEFAFEQPEPEYTGSIDATPPADSAQPASPTSPPTPIPRRAPILLPPLPLPPAPTPWSAPSPPAPAAPPRRPAPHAPARRLGRRQGVPELLDHGPVDPGLLTDLLRDPDGLPVGLGRLRIRRICTDPTGQVIAVDDRTLTLRQLVPDGATAQTILARLSSTLPPPPPATSNYTPTAAQARTVRARDATCTFPGCARRARRCELDHRTRYRDSGPTSVVNLHPLCTHHHRLKHDGWTCTRTPDGTTSWTSPRGQHLTTRR